MDSFYPKVFKEITLLLQNRLGIAIDCLRNRLCTFKHCCGNIFRFANCHISLDSIHMSNLCIVHQLLYILNILQSNFSDESDSYASSLRSEEHTSELQSRQYIVCRLLLEKKNIKASSLRSRTSR